MLNFTSCVRNNDAEKTYMCLVANMNDCHKKINTTKIGKNTPLGYAVMKGYNRLADVLLCKDADVNFPDANHDTPLHLAVSNNRMEFVTKLLRKNADPNARGSDGNTPLNFAVMSGNIDLVKKLLELPQIDCTIANDKNQRPWDLSADGEFRELIEARMSVGTHFGKIIKKCEELEEMKKRRARLADELHELELEIPVKEKELETLSKENENSKNALPPSYQDSLGL